MVVLVHGLMCDESFWRDAEGLDFGQRLAAELGFVPVYLRYNTGLAIEQSGAELARLLDELVASWPVALDELVLIGHSMGGLVIRSACHFGSEAGAAWLPRVRRCIYLGTPHRGAPLERAARLATKLLRSINDPYTRLVGELADLRSTGIQALGDPRHPIPLLEGIEHLLVAGTLVRDGWLAQLFGDALVPVDSAHDGARAQPHGSQVTLALLPGRDHMALARHVEVYAHVRSWCERP